MAYIMSGLKARNRQQKMLNDSITERENIIKSNRKPYTASPWAREMCNTIKSQTSSDGTYKPGGAFLEELDKKGGLPKVPEHAKDDLRADGISI